MQIRMQACQCHEFTYLPVSGRVQEFVLVTWLRTWQQIEPTAPPFRAHLPSGRLLGVKGNQMGHDTRPGNLDLLHNLHGM